MKAMGDFYGLPTGVLENPWLRLEYLTQAGPRIVRLTVAGQAKNLLAETPDLSWPTPYGDFYLRGGHRLWHAPEAAPRSAVPDTTGLRIEEIIGGVRLCGLTETPTGIRKAVEICLANDYVELRHILTNDGLWPVELAAWAITQLPLGGLAVLPQRSTAAPRAGLLPDRHVVLWPYTRWEDARLHLDDDCAWLEARSGPVACKIGIFAPCGWIGYLNDGVLFVKRFQPHPARPHVDRGCNAEIYCGDRFIELETLGPLSRLEPGAAVTHVETWEVYSCPGVPATPDGVRELCASLRL